MKQRMLYLSNAPVINVVTIISQNTEMVHYAPGKTPQLTSRCHFQLSRIKNKSNPFSCNNERKNNLLCIHFFISSLTASSILKMDIIVEAVFHAGNILVTEKILQDNSSLLASNLVGISVLVNDKSILIADINI